MKITYNNLYDIEHYCTWSTFLTAKTTSLGCGIVKGSKLLVYGIGTSAPVTLTTGASK